MVNNLTWSVLAEINTELQTIATSLSVTLPDEPTGKEIRDIKSWLTHIESCITAIYEKEHKIGSVSVNNPYYIKPNVWNYGKQKGAYQKVERWYNFIEWENEYTNGKIIKSNLYCLDDFGQRLLVKDSNGNEIMCYGG